MPARPLIPLDIIKEPFNNSFTMDGIVSGSWIVGNVWSDLLIKEEGSVSGAIVSSIGKLKKFGKNYR